MSKLRLGGLFLILVLSIKVYAISGIENTLKGYDRLIVKKIQTLDGYKESYLIMMTQPLDHDAPGLGSFCQRIWLNHLNDKAPMVMVTEGYSANRNYQTELAKELKANQLIVEHRYFEASTPEKKDWKYLTVKNAAADHHEIIKLFQKLYKGKWLTTGISKGGQTTLFHRALYPKDVDVSVPYVAPVNLEREDPRLLAFFEKVGSQDDRAKIKAFQKLVLQRKERLLPLFQSYSEKNKLKFAKGIEQAYELGVMEYPFAFWQWGYTADKIPGSDASDEEVLNHFIKGSSIDYFSIDMMKQFESFFYQAYKELGYYNYVPGDLQPLMDVVKSDTISSCMFAPGGDTLSFNKATMQMVVSKLNKYNPKMVLICGEYDPWGATSLDVANMSKSLKVVKPKGSHKARINNLSEAKKEEVWALLKKWMKVRE
ncbi:S28 family serine protease [Plebeiibacterium marinum]|uniref:S28 family serine protease n=1 Tax=Plebeiibacterium marinum TaxID=2992111 RepID=A0AAE3MIC0_9BACT|nr:S28 family serine protease [Plebeiobacterium marinum]MCW3807617.1 S28 family serine protease [Plebeiobacterium marinum]